MEFKFETDYKESNIIVIKLVTGEELIGKIAKVADDELTLEGVFAFNVMQVNPNTPPQLTLVPYYVSAPASEMVSISRDKIVSKLRTTPETTKSAYIANTSGLAVPSVQLNG